MSEGVPKLAVGIPKLSKMALKAQIVEIWELFNKLSDQIDALPEAE